MATIRLVPSTYYLSNSSYLRVANADNMYDNTDSTTAGTFTHNRQSTSSTYYAYLRGFNFDDVPSNATVSGFTVKIKASATGHTTSTSTSYYMSLSNGTTQIGSTYASGRLSTSIQTFTFSEGSLTWETIKNYGSNFSIRIPLRRSSSNTADVVSVYGAEIEVTYTVPNPRTLTVSASGNGTVTPSGTSTVYDDDEVEIVISPTNKSDTVTATHNGTDVTSQLVAHGSETTQSTVLGAYSLVSGGFNSYGDGASYFSGLVGAGVDHTQVTSNYYSVSSSNNAVFQYEMNFALPSNAVVERVYCLVNGHAESTSSSDEYMCVQLKSGNTDLSELINFKDVGTTNTTITLEASTIPTVRQLESMVLECTVGYYGGAINGATCYVVYSVGEGLDHYTYTFTVSGDATIVVNIGGQGEVNTAYIKVNGAWKEVTVHKKVSGSWQQVTDPTTVIDTIQRYYLKS